jgi:predicted transcriptional regulator YheO
MRTGGPASCTLGQPSGRPKKLADAKRLELAQTPYDSGDSDIDTICATLGISRATLYRYLQASRGP